MGADEEGTLAQLHGHRRALVDPKIKEHHGRIVKTTGDGMLVEFASVVDAVPAPLSHRRSRPTRCDAGSSRAVWPASRALETTINDSIWVRFVKTAAQAGGRGIAVFALQRVKLLEM